MTSNNVWDDEAARYLAMPAIERVQWLSRLLFALTMEARDTYTVGEDGLDDPIRMRRFNELTHRTTSQLQDHIEKVSGRPDEVFLRIVRESMPVLRINPANVVRILRR